MTRRKDVSFSLNVKKLESQIAEKINVENNKEDIEPKVRSAIFSLGKDPRVGAKFPVSAPDLYLLEILKDRMDNPYIQLNWRIQRSDVDSGKIVGFNIFRRKLSEGKDISFRGILNYNTRAVDRLAVGNKKFGRFSSERKSIYNIKRGSIPLQILNPNLASIQKNEGVNLFAKDISEDSTSYSQSDFERFFSNRKFEKLVYIDYTKFSAEEKNRFLVVKDRNFIEISHKDKSVGFSETFEYYIEVVTKQLGEAPRSNSIIVTVEDTDGVNPPSKMFAKQVNENEIQISVSANPADKIAKFIFYRKSDDEIAFDRLIEVNNTADTVIIGDGGINYSKSYTYRVFLQNIHGALSEPGEITVFSSVQKITPQSRSNNLKIPIINAVQDQNSDFAKITIYPNDPNISFYELQRRDMTLYEKKFTVPSKLENNYGGTGWPASTFFVERARVPLSQESNSTTSELKTKTTTKEIVFVDNTVSPGHIYQYRTRGYDLFGNPSSYAFSTVKISGKKSIRTPFNIRAEILRGFPFRVKILWDDDNFASSVSEKELFEGESTVDKKSSKTLYKVQRRKLGEMTYESFPATANKFIIDEVSTPDAVNFEGKLIEDSYERISNSDPIDENMRIKDEIRRAFKLPNFLKENDIYFYRIIAISDIGEESNASEEFQISSLADISNPLNFSAEVINAQVRPITVKLSWDNDFEKSRPDYWVIEKKFDGGNDSFSVIGKAYLENQLFDRNVEIGNTYVYRIKAFDVIGRETAYFETRITL